MNRYRINHKEGLIIYETFKSKPELHQTNVRLPLHILQNLNSLSYMKVLQFLIH